MPTRGRKSLGLGRSGGQPGGKSKDGGVLRRARGAEGGLGTGGSGGGSEVECPALATGEGLGLQWVVLLKDARPDGELELGDLLLYGGVD